MIFHCDQVIQPSTDSFSGQIYVRILSWLGPQLRQSVNPGFLSAMTHPSSILPCQIILLCLDCAPIIRNEIAFEKGDSFVKKIPSPAKREGIPILLYENDLF